MKKKTNILFILTDDQGIWSLGSYGNKEIISPNIDKLAETGIRFDNFFCTSPVCSPARASIITGKIPSQHGVHDWISVGNLDDPKAEYSKYTGKDRQIEYLKDQKGYVEFLKKKNYVCGISGKWHLGAQQIKQKGFDFWYIYGLGGGDYYNYPMVENGKVKMKQNYTTNEITLGALKFLDKYKNENNPFYLSVHYTAPHSPYEKEFHPDKYLNLYKDCKFKSIPEKPIHKWQMDSPILPHTKEKQKEFLTSYYAAVTAMDDDIGKIIDKLKKIGEYENTLIIFTSDNGFNMGHHGLWGKGNASFPMNMYDSSVKVPFIVSMPTKLRQNKVESGLYSQYDIMPTLLDFVNIKNTEKDKLPGNSFLPTLVGDTKQENEAVVIFDEYGPVRMIRTNEYKYIHRYPYGPHELYDLNNDPNEEINLIDDNTIKYQKIIMTLRKKLENWFNKYIDPEKNGQSLPVTGLGQINIISKDTLGQDLFNQGYKIYKEN